MNSLQPIGGYYPMDEKGRVLNRTDQKHMAGQWALLANEVLESFRDRYGEQLSGVYVRGSVPAGTAVPGISDIDCFAVLKWEAGGEFYRWEEPNWTKQVAENLRDRFPIASKIEMAVCSWKGGDFSHSPKVRDLIATQSLCIWGNDLVKTLPAPTFGQLKRNLPWIGEDYETYIKAVKMEVGEIEAARTFVKTLIRGAFESVMELEGKYATDFYPCIETISKYKPDWRGRLLTLVHIFTSPEGRQMELVEVSKPLVEALTVAK